MREVTMRNWWRWALRGVAVVEVVSGVVFPAETVTLRCPSAYDRAHGTAHTFVVRVSPPNSTGSVFVPASSCNPVTMDYNVAASALGIGAVVLIALSFWRRGRPVVNVPVNPSVL